MLKSKYKIYLLLLCLTGCVSEYNAQLPSSDEELLVVTGDIIANTEAIFSLSKVFHYPKTCRKIIETFMPELL